jgi:hypothetical protein
MLRCRLRQSFSFLLLCFVLGGCQPKQTSTQATPSPANSATLSPVSYLSCDHPYLIELGQWFTLSCHLNPADPKIAKDTTVTADRNDSVLYDPKSLPMKPGKTYLVRVKIKRGSPSGISNIALFAGDEYARYSLTLDVGFTGHLKITPANMPLSYNSPATFKPICLCLIILRRHLTSWSWTTRTSRSHSVPR